MIYILPIVCLIIGLVIWYFYYGFECYMNGASTWAHPIFMPFQCLLQELGWLVIPGRKVNFLRDEIIGLKYSENVSEGYILGTHKTWSYREVVSKQLYKECSRDIMPGPLHFLSTHILIPLIPLAIWAAFHFRA